MNKPQTETLRSVIRELLAAELAVLRTEKGASPEVSPKPQSPAGIREESVPVNSTEELTSFARRICELAQEEETCREIREGRWIFHPEYPHRKRDGAGNESGDVRVEKGLVGEHQIASMAEGTCIHAGKRVCFTPLAMDEIRHRRIRIVWENWSGNRKEK